MRCDHEPLTIVGAGVAVPVSVAIEVSEIVVAIAVAVESSKIAVAIAVAVDVAPTQQSDCWWGAAGSWKRPN